MAMRDEIKEQKRKSGDMSLKEKFANYWYYHKLHTLFGAVMVVLLFFLMRDVIDGNKESLLDVALFNTTVSTVDENFLNEYTASLNMNPKKQTVSFDNSYVLHPESSDPMSFAAMQKMMANVQVGQLDILMAESEVVDYYASVSFLSDVKSVLPAELLAQYEKDNRIYYTKTEDGTRIAAGIYIDDSKRLQETQLFQMQKPILSIAVSAKQLDNILAFLSFLDQ